MGRPAPFPHRYEVELQDRRMTAAAQEAIAVGPPPQFGGSDHVWSPEELLVGAALECLWTTFEAYAKRDALTYAEWAGKGVGILDRGPKGPVFTSIRLTVDVRVAPNDVSRAETILRNAERDCIISRALQVPVLVEPAVAGTLNAGVAEVG